MDNNTIGNVILRERQAKKLSQEIVSSFADIGRTHLSAIERGERIPTLKTFIKLADALELAPSVLMAKIEEEMAKNES